MKTAKSNTVLHYNNGDMAFVTSMRKQFQGGRALIESIVLRSLIGCELLTIGMNGGFCSASTQENGMGPIVHRIALIKTSQQPSQ